jgi:iron complex outermembrane recepter protein
VIRGSPAFVDVTSQVPGLYVEKIGTGAGGSVSLRGVASVSFDAGVDQMVSVVAGNVATSRGRELDAGLFDVRTIEVLKGPQALFFGKNSPGGIISISSVSPGQEFEGYVRGSYTFENRRPMIEGAVTVPLSDTFSVRFAGRAAKSFHGLYKNHGAECSGYWESSLTVPVLNERLDEPRIASGRVTAVWRPSDNFDVTAKVLYDHFRDNAEACRANHAR